ncbi:hypothetical protein DWQ65_01645 [Treponema phagedenis]|nr:hypothetical protein FUT79_01410 [Treponema phagedenis]QEK01992.1 hypothetical protein FUT84_13015 [Treponema phagedenis]QEK07106.1 hypothetical protein FUT80_10495 [Treponema phagedenis]QSH98797.1 hypothetical protein DWQ65_01645 [Treponema phagedenis]
MVPHRRFGFATDGKKSERARTPVVPCRNDVLKQSNLQSFKTRRFGFDMDVKTKPLCRTLCINFVSDTLKICSR